MCRLAMPRRAPILAVCDCPINFFTEFGLISLISKGAKSFTDSKILKVIALNYPPNLTA